MHLARFVRLPVGLLPWHGPELTWTFIVKATFRLADGVAALASTQEPLAYDELAGEDTAELRRACDFAPFKPRADVLLVGSARAAAPATIFQVRVAGAGMERRALVVAPSPRRATPLAQVGPRAVMRGPAAALVSPSGVLERPLAHPFDFSAFNVAPVEQQLPFLREDTAFVIEGVASPAGGPITLRMPSFRPRLLAAASVDAPEARALDLVCDTLLIDADCGLFTLSYRCVCRPLEGFVFVLALGDHAGAPAWPTLRARLKEAEWITPMSPPRSARPALASTPAVNDDDEQEPPTERKPPVQQQSPPQQPPPPQRRRPVTLAMPSAPADGQPSPGSERPVLPFVRTAQPAPAAPRPADVLAGLPFRPPARPPAPPALDDDDDGTGTHVPTGPVATRGAALPFVAPPANPPALDDDDDGTGTHILMGPVATRGAALPFAASSSAAPSPPRKDAPRFDGLPFSPTSRLSPPVPAPQPAPAPAPARTPAPAPAPAATAAPAPEQPKPESPPEAPAVGLADIERYAAVKAAFWGKDDPRAAMDDVLRELGIGEDTFRAEEQRLLDAIAEEARQGRASLSRALRAAMKRAQQGAGSASETRIS